VVRLEDYPIERILTSPTLRWRQTVEPLARDRRLRIEGEVTLGVDADLGRVLALLADPRLQDTVVCTHGEVIGQVLSRLVADGLAVDQPLAWPRARPGCWTAPTDDLPTPAICPRSRWPMLGATHRPMGRVEVRPGPPDRLLEDSMRAPIPVRLLLLAMVWLVAAACGGAGDNTSGAAAATTTTAASGTTAAASQACADAAAVKASVAELDQLDPPTAGKAGIQAALDKVSTNLAALKTSAKSQWSSQLAELDGAVAALKTTIAGINSDNLVSELPTIVSDLRRIDSAWTDQDCG
jgi:hypothetical protein